MKKLSSLTSVAALLAFTVTAPVYAAQSTTAVLTNKTAEAKCGANKTAEAKCGANKAKKSAEGKCGEAKCGASKKH